MGLAEPITLATGGALLLLAALVLERAWFYWRHRGDAGELALRAARA